MAFGSSLTKLSWVAAYIVKRMEIIWRSLVPNRRFKASNCARLSAVERGTGAADTEKNPGEC